MLPKVRVCERPRTQCLSIFLRPHLLGFYLPAFHTSVRKSQRLSPKFYVFDTGVKKALEESLDQKPVARTSVYGELFEHLVILEILKLNAYFEKRFRISYFATKHGTEVDLVLSKGARKNILIEIKSTDRVDETEVRALHRTAESFPSAEAVSYVSNDPHARKIESVECLHYLEFVRRFRDLVP